MLILFAACDMRTPSLFGLGPVRKFALPIGSPFLYNKGMAEASVSSTKKKIGRPRKPYVAQHMTMSVNLSNALDAWIAAQPDSPGRPEAIRRLLKQALETK